MAQIDLLKIMEFKKLSNMEGLLPDAYYRGCSDAANENLQQLRIIIKILPSVVKDRRDILTNFNKTSAWFFT